MLKPWAAACRLVLRVRLLGWCGVLGVVLGLRREVPLPVVLMLGGCCPAEPG